MVNTSCISPYASSASSADPSVSDLEAGGMETSMKERRVTTSSTFLPSKHFTEHNSEDKHPTVHSQEVNSWALLLMCGACGPE